MRSFGLGLSAAIMGVGVAAIVCPQRAMALSIEQIDLIAKEITVKIDSQNPGSGTIIAKEGNVYYVLTCEHVVGTDDVYEIITPDGEKHPLTYSKVRKIPTVDLAVVQFTSNKQYRVATLAGNRLLKLLESERGPNYVFVSGFPSEAKKISNHSDRKFNSGIVLPSRLASILSYYPPSDGYNILYSNITYPGMSGGPVLDGNGRVIGIHGRSEGEFYAEDQFSPETSPLNIGLSLGIPITTFLKLAPSAGIHFSVTTESSPPDLIGKKAFSPATPKENSSAVEWANYGNALWRSPENYKEALPSYDRALALKPNFYQVWTARGFLLMMLEKNDEAIASLDKATQVNPRYWQAWRFRSLALSNQSRFQEALDSIDRAIQINSRLSSVWTIRGALLENLNRNNEAIEAYTNAIAISPSSLDYNNRGFIYYRTRGGLRKAIADFSEAIRLNPEEIPPYRNRANAYVRLREYDKAIADCDKLIEISPDLPEAYTIRSSAKGMKGNYRGATIDLENGLRMAKRKVRLAQQSGDLSTSQRYERLQVEIQRAIQIYRNHSRS